MSEFVYAPKDDPYVSSPHWYLSYSQVRADMVEELMDACRSHHMEFTWCIRPDLEYSWTEEDYSFLLGKLEMMHYIGVRSFGVLLDDIPYEEGKVKAIGVSNFYPDRLVDIVKFIINISLKSIF